VSVVRPAFKEVAGKLQRYIRHNLRVL
jgi:hypothetical protein